MNIFYDTNQQFVRLGYIGFLGFLQPSYENSGVVGEVEIYDDHTSIIHSTLSFARIEKASLNK
jgi:hypothetical protein